MNSKQIVEDIFNKHGINWEVKDFDKFINPNCKTAKSIFSKLTRLYFSSNCKNLFTISSSGISDLLRMTLIVEYNEVIPTIYKLKKAFPDLSGYLKIKDSGYRGIHLNLKIDGIPCEIQLTPKTVVMAINYLHTLHEKWRDFDYDREMKLLSIKSLNILRTKDLEKKSELLKSYEYDMQKLQEKKLEEKKDFKLRKNTYSDVYAATKFEYYINDIENVINEINNSKVKPPHLSDNRLLEVFNENLLTNGELDVIKLKKVSEYLSNNIALKQEKFVNMVNNYLMLN